MRNHAFAALLMSTLAFPLLAETGDAAAVIQYCGTPTSEHQGISDVTSKMQRDLAYGGLILHFVPAEDGWSFQSGWYDHLPLTEKMTEARLACFQRAMAASRAEQPGGSSASEDPTIRQQVIPPAGNESTFGVPHLWLIIALVVLVIIFFLLPRAKRQQPTVSEVERMRQRRKPRILDRPFRKEGR